MRRESLDFLRRGPCDFYNEFSATDILLGPADLCSHVIVVERRHFDVHAFYHRLSPLFEVQPQIAQEYAPYSALPSMIWRAPVFPHTWDAQAVVPFALEEMRAPDRASLGT
jgi:hypothetical protein